MSEPVRKSRRIAEAAGRTEEEEKAVQSEQSYLTKLIDRMHDRYVTMEHARGSMDIVLAAAVSLSDTIAQQGRAVNGEGEYRGLSMPTRRRIAGILEIEVRLLKLCGNMELRRVGVDESDREEEELGREQ